MMNKKTKVRTCLGCRIKAQRSEFIRIVKVSDDEVVIDESGKTTGRGAYICLTKECMDKALKKKVIDKALRVNMGDSSLKELKEKLKIHKEYIG